MEIERELGITQGLLNKWKRKLKNEGQAAFPGRDHQLCGYFG
jgi:transposase-like protein